MTRSANAVKRVSCEATIRERPLCLASLKRSANTETQFPSKLEVGSSMHRMASESPSQPWAQRPHIEPHTTNRSTDRSFPTIAMISGSKLTPSSDQRIHSGIVHAQNHVAKRSVEHRQIFARPDLTFRCRREVIIKTRPIASTAIPRITARLLAMAVPREIHALPPIASETGPRWRIFPPYRIIKCLLAT